MQCMVFLDSVTRGAVLQGARRKGPQCLDCWKPFAMRILLPWVLIVAVRPCCTSIWGLVCSPDFARPFGSFMSVEPFSLSEGVIMCVLISLEFACTGNLSGKCLLRWAGELFVPDVAAADSHEEKGAAVQGAAASSAGACSCGRH